MQTEQREDNKKAMKKYVKLMGNAVSVLSILFILAALFRTDFSVIPVTDWRGFLMICVTGVLLKTGTVFLSASAWCLWLEFFSGRRCSRREALRVYAKANIGKYLPGNVMHYVERNLFAGKLGLTQKQIAAASMAEAASLLSAAAVVGGCMAYDNIWEVFCTILLKLPGMEKVSERQIRVFLAAGMAAAAVFLAVLLYVFYSRRKKEKISRNAGTNGNPAKTFFFCFVIYAAVLTILGLLLVLVYSYWAGPPSFALAFQMTAAYMIAWVLGFVIPGAPGGIGVREMALTLLLFSAVGGEMIVSLSVVHRLLTVLGDFAAYLVRNIGK